MTIVVAVQDRVGSRAALRAAAQEAGFRQARLVAVTAYSSDGAAAAPAARPVATALCTAGEERALAESVLRDAALDALGADAAQVELRVVQGLPGRSLIDAARTLEAELLVVGSRGGKSVSWLLGSQYVLRNAPCPILLVPETG
jgi:nucleotide-binding universal stress UspA family protein